MKTVVIGDIHGRTLWEDILLEEADYDKVVFLGDYVSSHEGISGEQQIRNLKKIMDLKENNPSRVVLLRGNHDGQHLGYSWAECCSLFRDVQSWLISEKDRFLGMTCWIHIDGNIIFSHAGISSVWMERSGVQDITEILNLPPSELFGFTPDHFSDSYGDSVTQPPTWIRPESLYRSRVPGYIQVIGHTPVRFGIVNIARTGDLGLWLCDALGLRQYLVIEDGEFKARTI